MIGFLREWIGPASFVLIIVWGAFGGIIVMGKLANLPPSTCLVSTSEAETCVCRTVTKKLVTQRICVCEVARD